MGTGCRESSARLLAPALIGELHGAYLRLPQRYRDILIGLMMAYSSAAWAAKRLGGWGLPTLAARAVQQCAKALGDPVWLGYAAWLRGNVTGHLDRATQYQRSVAAAENLTCQLDSSDALQACGMLHLSATLAAGAQADRATAATHLQETLALAARMDTEVGTWANLCAMAVRQGEEHRVMSGQALRRGIGQDALGQRDEVRVMLAEPASRVAAGRELTDLDQRVAEHQAQQLTTRVSARPRHRHPHRHVDDYAYYCKIIQYSVSVA